jgi:hypothetical protein
MCINQGARVETPHGKGTVGTLDDAVSDYARYFPEDTEDFRSFMQRNEAIYGDDVYVKLDSPVIGGEFTPGVMQFNVEDVTVLSGDVPAQQ